MHEWSNWSGSLRFTPSSYMQPGTEEELRKIVTQAFSEGCKVRLAAAGHSSTPLVKTEENLINLANMKGLVSCDVLAGTATFLAGTTVHEANQLLQEKGLALFNTGDVDVQTLAGAIATGTHGSGVKLQNLASVLTGVRMITYKGDVQCFNEQEHPEIMNAMRVSLGAMGIFSEITVKVVPVFRLRRLEIFTDADTCVKHFDELAEKNRNVDFYWYPRSDEVKIRILNEPGHGMNSFPFSYKCVDDEEGWVGEILPRYRELKFDEMEYALPRQKGLTCFQLVRARIKERHRKHVAWRVLFRCIASDNNYLSPHYQRESTSISLHHNAGLPFEDFFNDIEPIFREHGGRPHWAKKHNVKYRDLRRMYPEWDVFHNIRKTMDPKGVFINRYLSELFGEA